MYIKLNGKCISLLFSRSFLLLFKSLRHLVVALSHSRSS